MATRDDIPLRCYELLSVIHAHGGRIPYRELSAEMRDIGLLKVSRHYELVELVLWYEPSPGPVVERRGDFVLIRPSAGWLPYYSMALSSVEEAIARDKDCKDPKDYLHVEMSSSAEIAFEERKLRSDDENRDMESRNEAVLLLPDAQQSVWDLLDGRALTAKQIAVELHGDHTYDDSIRKRIAGIRKTGRRIKNRRGRGYYRPDAPPPDQTGAERESG